MPYSYVMEFIEASLFTKYVYAYLIDDEYLGLQSYLFQFLNLERLFLVQAESENYVGLCPVQAKEVAFGLSTISKSKMMKSGY